MVMMAIFFILFFKKWVILYPIVVEKYSFTPYLIKKQPQHGAFTIPSPGAAQ